MNNKGQVNQQLGIIIVVAITLIVGVILFQVVAQETGKSTNTVNTNNVSLSSAAVNGTAQYLSYRALSDVVVYNATGGVTIPSSNYTIANNVINPTTGDLAVSITPNEPAPELGYDVGIWTVDATAQPTTYIANSGARSVTSLIAIFFALAILVVSLSPTLRSEFLNLIGR